MTTHRTPPANKRPRARRLRLLRRDPHCWYCGKTLRAANSSLDHITPRAHGGRANAANTVLACLDCNHIKDDAPLSQIVCLLPRGSGIELVPPVPLLERSPPMPITAKPRFNYDSLEGRAQSAARDSAQEIHSLLKTGTRSAVEIGLHLCKMFELLGTGRFHVWVKAEFNWGQPAASNYMQLARKFADLDCLDNFQPTALVVLMRKSAPAAAVPRAIDRARKGQIITRKEALNIIRELQPAAIAPRGDARCRLRHAIESFSKRFGLDVIVEELARLALELQTELLAKRAAVDTTAPAATRPARNEGRREPATRNEPAAPKRSADAGTQHKARKLQVA